MRIERIGSNIIGDVPGRTISFDIRGHATPRCATTKHCTALYREILVLPEVSSPILSYFWLRGGIVDRLLW